MSRACSTCNNSVGPRNKTGLCRTCSAKALGQRNKKPERFCGGCSVKLVKSRTGYCRTCFNLSINSDPEVIARRREGVKRWAKANPLAVQMRSKRGAATRSKDEAYLARIREIVRTRVQPLSATPEAVAKRDYKARGKAISRAKLPWCPPEYVETYRLLRRKGIPVADARAATEAEIARNALSPFERQMRALERGARLVANDARPSLANPGVYSAEQAA